MAAKKVMEGKESNEGTESASRQKARGSEIAEKRRAGSIS